MAGRKAGPKKKPSIMRYIEGTGHYRGGLPADEPTPDLLSPEAKPPAHLNEEEAKHWTATVGHLCRMRILSVADMSAIERYAQLRAIWDMAMRRGATDGWYTLRTKRDRETGGEKVQSSSEAAWLRTAKQIAPILLRLETEFGFTPSSRTEISTDANKRTNLDSIEAFIEG